eukprot:4421301-Prymnesium_polylepis.3
MVLAHKVAWSLGGRAGGVRRASGHLARGRYDIFKTVRRNAVAVSGEAIARERLRVVRVNAWLGRTHGCGGRAAVPLHTRTTRSRSRAIALPDT